MHQIAFNNHTLESNCHGTGAQAVLCACICLCCCNAPPEVVGLL